VSWVGISLNKSSEHRIAVFFGAFCAIAATSCGVMIGVSRRSLGVFFSLVRSSRVSSSGGVSSGSFVGSEAMMSFS